MLLIGSSGHARVLVDIIELAGIHTIVGLLDDSRPQGTTDLGYPILGRVAAISEISVRHGATGFMIAIGDNWNRGLVRAKIGCIAPALQSITAIHPHAQVARTARVGAGTAVMAGAVINSGASIGRFCIVNTQAAVDHNSCLEDFSSVGPGATLAGNVQVGAYSAICLQACVSEKVRIGSHTVVGAGSAVLADLPDEVLAYGAPARVIRPRTSGEPYLR